MLKKEELLPRSDYEAVMLRIRNEKPGKQPWLVRLEATVFKDVMAKIEAMSICEAFALSSDSESKHASELKEYIQKNAKKEFAKMTERVIALYTFSEEEFEALIAGLARPTRAYADTRAAAKRREDKLIQSMREWPVLIVLRLLEMSNTK